MASFIVQGVPLIGQPTDGVCWFASSQMLFAYSSANGGNMKDPATVDMTKQMFDRNSTWDNSNAVLLASTLNMVTHDDAWLSMDLASIQSRLQTNGPIWTAVQKDWRGHDHGHVIVIAGVRDGASGGVFIHDPEPMKGGSSYWLTFAQIKRGVDRQTGSDFHYLTAK